MSVTVRHLNGDSTFLLIFSPEANPRPTDLRTENGAYSVLIDPWIVGSSVTTAPWFAITNRVEPSCIQHLSDLEDEPDVVMCSQNKTDHTNKETLLQLRPDANTLIVAEPGAARLIKSWNHFESSRVYSMAKYDAQSKVDNVLRLTIPPLSPEGDAGLVTISFIPAKNYLTGLHNAFGVTYQPPTRTKSLTSVSTVDLSTAQLLQQTMIRSPPPCPPMFATLKSDLAEITQANTDQSSMRYMKVKPQSSTADSIHPQVLPVVVTPPEDSDVPYSLADATGDFSFFDFGEHVKPEPFSVSSYFSTPPESPSFPISTRSSSFSTVSSSRGSSVNSLRKTTTTGLNVSDPDKLRLNSNRSKTISIIYSPHGLPLNDLQPYIRNHLIGLPGALPLTLLLHSFDFTTNPWYLGGNITTGAEGGMEIAKALMAKCWISAHDAEKDKQGIAIKMLKCKKVHVGEVRQQFQTPHPNEAQQWNCDIRAMEVGEELVLSNHTKRAVGFGADNYTKPATASSSAISVPAMTV